MITKQFLVFGRVQGVGFRFFTLQEAGKIGVTGSVRNRQDGSVEVFAQGTEAQISQLRDWLHKGSKTSRVENVVELTDTSGRIFENFAILR